MRRIFTFCFIAIALVAASFNSFGQCTQTAYNFQTSTTTEGFTGTRTAGTGTFSALAPASNELRSTVTANSNNTYTITSPTFSIPAISPTINFTFDYSAGPQATVTIVQYQIRYVSTSTNTVVTTPIATYTNGTCTTFNRPADMSGNDYQIVAIYTVTGGNGNASNSYIGFDNFGTNGTLSAIILPVKFSSLDARTTNNAVSLKWTVGSEINVIGYEIEKSSDGRNFAKIGFVPAAAQTSYSFVDPKPSSVSYYRIKSVDGDGKYTFSTVALVKAGKSMIVLKAFPSPFTKSVSVQHASANGSSLISISSEDGRLIKTVVPVTGTQQTDINLSSAAPGLYLIRFTNGNKDVQTLKILKQQ